MKRLKGNAVKAATAPATVIAYKFYLPLTERLGRKEEDEARVRRPA